MAAICFYFSLEMVLETINVLRKILSLNLVFMEVQYIIHKLE